MDTGETTERKRELEGGENKEDRKYIYREREGEREERERERERGGGVKIHVVKGAIALSPCTCSV